MTQVVQNTIAWLDFYFTQKSDDEPATGLTWSDVVIEYKKATDTSFTTLVLGGASEFNEIGNGVYNAKFPAACFSVLGTFRFVVNGALGLSEPVWQWLDSAEVVAASAVVPVQVPLDSCNIWGNISSLTGSAVKDVSVGLKIFGTPQLLSSLYATPRAALTTTQLQTTSDENGFFYFTVARGSVVDLVIPSCDYRKTFTVPLLASANVFEI